MFDKLCLALILFLGCTCLSAQDWELHSDKDGIQVYTLEQPDSKIKRLRATVTIDATIEQAVNAQLDVENMPIWYDRIANVELLQRVSPVNLDIGVLIDLPWPLKDRYTTLAATGSIDQQQDVLTITTAYVEKPINTNMLDDVVLVTEIGSSWIIKSVGTNQIYIDHEVYLDPGGVLPAWLINLTSTEGPRKTLEGFRKIVQSYPDKLPNELEALR